MLPPPGSRCATSVAGVTGVAGLGANSPACATNEEQPNGRYVLGELLDAAPYTDTAATEYFSVRTTGTRGKFAQQVSVVGTASLKSVGGDGTFSGTTPAFNGLTLPSAVGTYWAILTVAWGDLNTTHYKVDVKDASGAVRRVCDDAVPLVGAISRTGAHLATPGRITLACVDGAAAKCLRWGYAPGLTSAGAMWGAHQACMQGVTADYCAIGATSTRTGTSISFLDDVGVNQVWPGAQIKTLTLAEWPPNTTDYYFETAFPPGHRRASCIGKLRWPIITNTCVVNLPDCSDTTIDDLIAQDGAVMFFASKYNQLRLERWIGGVDRVTTVRGYHNVDQEKPPQPGYEYAGTDGILLRIPPLSVPLSSLVAVSLYTNLQTQDHFLAKSQDPRFVAPQFERLDEGYVYATQAMPNMVPLRLYRHPTTSDLTSTTADLATMAGLGYGPVSQTGDVIGWIAPL